MSLRAYVLMEVEVGRLTTFRQALARFADRDPRVLAAETVTGPYDAILLLAVDDLDALGLCLAECVQLLVGVTRTTSCVAFGA